MYDDKQIEKAAEAAHEVNRVYCRLVMGDSSHLLWKDTPEHIRKSVISGVRSIIDNPALTPAASHEAWLEYKKAEGWVHGPQKNLGAKTHPCMVPYAQLPLGDRVKDALFGTVVRAALGIEHHVAVDTAAENIKGGQLGQ